MRAVLLVALPALVVTLSILVWVTAVSRSGFWADDFFNMLHYNRSLGDLSYHANQGKYVINVFWALGTLAFGLSSVVPYLILNSLVFAIGVVIWLWAGTRARWGTTEAWWAGGLFLATAAWLPTALWSSNIVHSFAFLAVGFGLLAHERSMRARTARETMLWSLACGAAWTLAVISDLLYLGVLVLAAYCAFHQMQKIRRFGVATPRAGGWVGLWNLLVPVIYFFAIAYPATTASGPYKSNGFQFIHQNLHFYREVLAPTTLLLALYIAILVVGLAGAALSIRRRDWFPLALLGAAGAVALGALIQSQQRDIHYMAMPLLLVFSALAASAHAVLIGQAKRVRQIGGGLLLVATVTLFLVFRQGTNVRSFFVQTPLGGALTAFRSEVAAVTQENGPICVIMNLDPVHQALFSAEISAEDGFLVPPISAAQAYLVPIGGSCPASTAASHVTVSLGSRSNFVVAANPS
jgi:hypothetical protein